MATGNIQIKNGKYYAVLNLKGENGKRKQKWINLELPIRGNKKAAEKILAELLIEYDDGELSPYNLTVADYFKRWLVEVKPKVKPNTYHSYHGNMVNHIIPYFEKKKLLLQDLKPCHLNDYYRYKMQPNSKLNSDEALSSTTIKHHHQNISKALADAVERELISVNPATAAKTPRAKKFQGSFLNPEEISSLLTLFKGSPVELPVILCSIYGFRRSEVLGLKWRNVDFVNRTITVCETLQQNSGGDYTDTPKTDSSYRTLPMLDDVYSLLMNKRQLQVDRRNLLRSYYKDSDYVCTLDDGSVISPNYLTRVFHNTITKSSLPHIRLHDLRHSVASNLLNNGFSVVQVQEWLGHGSAATTLNFYAHVDKTSKSSIANALQNMFECRLE